MVNFNCIYSKYYYYLNYLIISQINIRNKLNLIYNINKYNVYVILHFHFS